MADFRVIWSDASNKPKMNDKAREEWKRRIRELQELHGEVPKEL